jgi:hypothetical protein
MKKKYYLIGIFLFCLLILSFGSENIVADVNDDDGVDDSFEDINERDIDIEFDDENPYGIEIETVLRTGSQIDEIEFELTNTSDGFSVETEYEQETGSNEFELSFKITFVSIIEYNDTNGDGMYNDSNDQFVKELKLDDFQPTIYNNITIPQTTNNLHYFIVNTTDGNFTAHIFIAEEFCRVNGTLLTPNQIKLDIEISNFSYDQSDSLLALNTTLKSEEEYEEDDDTEDEQRGYSENEEWLITNANDTTGYFSWNKSANVDGKIKNVIIGNRTNMGEYERLYINYPNGTHIYHDPKIGIAWILKPIPLSNGGSGGGSSSAKSAMPILNIIYILALVLIIGASIAATSIYHYQRKKNLAIFYESEREESSGILTVRDKSSGKILMESRIKGELLQVFEGENALENLSQLSDLNITAISQDFIDEIDQFDWEEIDKREFIKEMLALTPKERKAILEEMKEKYFSTSS